MLTISFWVQTVTFAERPSHNWWHFYIENTFFFFFKRIDKGTEMELCLTCVSSLCSLLARDFSLSKSLNTSQHEELNIVTAAPKNAVRKPGNAFLVSLFAATSQHPDFSR